MAGCRTWWVPPLHWLGLAWHWLGLALAWLGNVPAWVGHHMPDADGRAWWVPPCIMDPTAPDAGWQAAGRGKVLGVSSHYDYEWDFRNRTIRYDSQFVNNVPQRMSWLPISMIIILECVSPGKLLFI